jgi:hypothetical protein
MRQLIRANLDAETMLGGVAIVICPRADLTGKHLVSYHVHAVIRAGDVLLELSGTPPHPLKPCLVPLLEPGDNTADSAQRFVDYGGMFCPEFPDRVRVRRDQGGRHREADCLNEERLVRFGTIAGHCRRAVHNARRCQISPGHQGIVDTHRVLPSRAKRARTLHGRQLSRTIRTDVRSSDPVQGNHPIGRANHSLNRTVNTELDLSCENILLVNECYCCIPSAQRGAHLRKWRIPGQAPQQNH